MENITPAPEVFRDTATGTILTPSHHGKACLGNGSHEDSECCCDECDYYLVCFPDWKEYREHRK